MKNSLRRIAALLMAIMMLSVLCMSVAAEGEESTDPSLVGFTKTLTKEEKAYAPKTTYTFTIAPGAADAANAIEAGIEGGALFVVDGGYDASLTITSTPDSTGADEDGVDTDQTSVVYNEQIKIDIDKFENPGIYRYVVTESDTAAYAGITYDTTVRTLDVYIQENATSHEMEIAGAFMYTSAKNTNFANTYTTTDLTISKTVSGNLGDTTKDFEFKITVTDVADAAESYYVEITDAQGAKTYETITSGAEATFNLAHNESFKVYGLSAGDTYTVTETAVTGYETTVDSAKTNSATGTIASTAVSRVFNNDRTVTVPTGIAMTILPFVAMILIAAVVAVLFFKKRERREA